MKKVELLAPAGNYESFLGAVHAGADAVYLGGAKFGARAYADNFTEEEVCSAIRYAHIYGRKVYLTLNTLVKEREFGEIYAYLLPFYEAGLDGVIIQDFGVFRAVGEWFPLLARHVSTQMTVMGSLGAEYLKELGAKRIVPARELSLAEIGEIKKETGIEIETFIHGAICYCYSGQCLFSSIIGGRSGNRGRCAQPCRLPYGAGKKGEKTYPLSLKDMCTIELLGRLIEAGIDSFKIEGRMKSPEYAAGVTAIYRKYIDRYYENPLEYRVEKQDIKKLQALYIRSGISHGYYDRHNGKDMITLENPGYTGRDSMLEEQIRDTYLEGDFRLPISAKARLVKGEEAQLALEWNGIGATVKGDWVQEAQKQPLTEEGIRKQLGKCGNTPFYLKELTIQASEDAFLPVKALNDLRRTALESLEREIIKANGFCAVREGRAAEIHQESESSLNDCICQERHEQESNGKAVLDDCMCQKEHRYKHESNRKDGFYDYLYQEGHEHKHGSEHHKECYDTKEKAVKIKLHVLAFTKEQCLAALSCEVERLYVDASLCDDIAWLEKHLKKYKETRAYVALPYILRQKDKSLLKKMEEWLESPLFSGVLVRNLEELQYLKKITAKKAAATDIVSDANLYVWNGEALHSLDRTCKESYAPYELNSHELKELADRAMERKLAISVYGRIPMMVSANCTANTLGHCRRKGTELEKRGDFSSLTDRYGKIFPVYLNCAYCYNVIYNSVPLSLHRDLDKIKEMGISVFRLDFTVENGDKTEEIIRFWQGWQQAGEKPPYGEYTKGHFKRGVE